MKALSPGLLLGMVAASCASGRGAAPHQDPLGMFERLVESKPAFSQVPTIPAVEASTIIVLEPFTDTVLSPTGAFLDERSEPSLENGAYHIPNLALHLTDAVARELERSGATVYRSWPVLGSRSPSTPSGSHVRTLRVHLLHAEIHRWRTTSPIKAMDRAIIFDLVGARYQFSWADARDQIVATGDGAHELVVSKDRDDLQVLAMHVTQRVLADLR